MAELGDAADSKSDSSIFDNPRNYDKNRTKSSQITFCTILPITGNSAYCGSFWKMDRTNTAHNEGSAKAGPFYQLHQLNKDSIP
jgi:hypothetical protein